MKYRKLGKTDLEVSEISLGCSGFWGNKKFPENKAVAVVFEAFERGVNFFDTGHNYCNFNAEPRLGRAVKEILARNDRSCLIISTKAGTVIPSASIIPTPRAKQKNFSPDHIEQSCAKSIENLNCGYLDIFQLHGISESEISEPLIERLLSMKQRGMYRYLGINTHTHSDIVFVSKHPEVFDMILLDYNVLQLDREPVISSLSAAGIGVVAGTVLGQGHLVKGKIGSLKTAADIWYLARALLKHTGRRLAKSSVQMRNTLASVVEMSSAQAAFAFILENSAIASCVFGTTSIPNLIEIIDASDKGLMEGSRSAIRKTFEALQSKVSE
jgi:aryl-alcohol dehydrogenase-like predicted oxidoreductase